MSEEEIEDYRLSQKLKLEAYEKCIEMIEELPLEKAENLSKEELEGMVEEIIHLIGELKDAY